MRTISDLAKVLDTFQVPYGEATEVVSLFQLALMEAFGDTHLPFLYDVLGRDEFLQVLDIFQDSEMIPCPHCDCPINWPARDELSTVMRDLIIYFRVERAPLGTKSAIIRENAEEFNITPGQVRYAHKVMLEKIARITNETIGT